MGLEQTAFLCEAQETLYEALHALLPGLTCILHNNTYSMQYSTCPRITWQLVMQVIDQHKQTIKQTQHTR